MVAGKRWVYLLNEYGSATLFHDTGTLLLILPRYLYRTCLPVKSPQRLAAAHRLAQFPP